MMDYELQAKMAELEEMEGIKKTLISWLKEETNNGKECFDTKSCGDVSDIIKDIAQATKDCYEAHYYKTVIEAMNEGGEPSYGEGPYGYNHRHMSNGRFASAGRGHYVRGYNPGPYMDQMPYIDAYMHDPEFMERMQGGNMNMGYNNSNGSGNSGNSGRSGGGNQGGGRGNMGYSRDGEAYENYRNARRHYQDSKSFRDKSTMEENCMSYMDNTIKNLKSIWEEADPSLKEKLRKDFGEELVGIMESSRG